MAERAFTWCRVSSEEQAGDDKTSLEIQAETTRAYAATRGYDVVRAFAAAGDKSDRPLGERAELTHMLDAIDRGECDVVVCRKPDRLARHQRYGMDIVNRIRDRGVRVEFVLAPHRYDLDNSIEYAMLSLAFLPGEMELANMKDRLGGGVVRASPSNTGPSPARDRATATGGGTRRRHSSSRTRTPRPSSGASSGRWPPAYGCRRSRAR